MMQGKKSEATELLMQESSRAAKTGHECYLNFAQFLLNRVEVGVFLSNSKPSQAKCTHFASASEALAHFWVAQRFILENDLVESKKHLIRFLWLSSKEDIIERGVAFRQLNLPIENRLNYIQNASKSDECFCALSNK